MNWWRNTSVKFKFLIGMFLIFSLTIINALLFVQTFQSVTDNADQLLNGGEFDKTILERLQKNKKGETQNEMVLQSED